VLIATDLFLWIDENYRRIRGFWLIKFNKLLFLLGFGVWCVKVKFQEIWAKNRFDLWCPNSKDPKSLPTKADKSRHKKTH
jgi:hypothetical protein